MRVTGDATLSASAESVRGALRDPDTLARLIPGCESLEVTSAGKAWLTVTTTLPGVDGTYTGEATVRERQAPGVLAARVSAAGVQGTIVADVALRLDPVGEDETHLSYDVDAEFDGAIAGVGKRMASSITKRLVGEFVEALDDEFAAPAPEAAPVQPARYAPEPARAAPSRADQGKPRPEAAVAAQRRAELEPENGEVDLVSRAGWPGAKAGLVVGGAVALAGVIVGALFRRRRRSSAGTG